MKYLIYILFFAVSHQAFATKILFVGDSLTEGYGIEKEKAYPSIIGQLWEKKFNQKPEILNAGISGSTSASAVSRLRWFMKKDPDIVVLALGANDILRGVKPAATEKNLEKAITFVLSKKKKVVLCGVRVPPNYGKGYGKEFEKVFKGLSSKFKVHFVPQLLEGVGGEVEMNQEDGIHPNEKGHFVMATNVFKTLEKLK